MKPYGKLYYRRIPTRRAHGPNSGVHFVCHTLRWRFSWGTTSKNISYQMCPGILGPGGFEQHQIDVSRNN